MSKVDRKVSCWYFSLDDALWSGRPVEVDSDQIETLTENYQHYTTQKIADILKISKSIKLLVEMKSTSFILQKKLNKLFGQPSIKTKFNQGGKRPILGKL